MEKMTNAKAISYVLSNCTLPSDVKDKMEKMLAQVQKKNSGEKKPTATQKANEGIKGAILSFFESNPNRLVTVTELCKVVPELADLSNQKVSALVRQLKDDGSVVRTEDKGKAYFQYKA